MIGVTAGYNWQGMGSPLVLGIEGDIDWSNITGSTVCAVNTVCQTSNSWLGTFRGRVGYAWDRVMPYVTGGLAVGDVGASVTGVPGTTRPTSAGPSAPASKR